MAPPSAFAAKLLLFMLFGSSIAAPISISSGESGGDVEQRAPEVELESEKRQTQANPLPIIVNVAGWQDIAEENCYVMLCQYGGQRVW